MQLTSMSNKSPFSKYQALVDSNQISFDASQQEAVKLLQQLYVMIESPEDRTKSTVIKGLYLWGKVGRGKTFLMDLLVNSLADNASNTLLKKPCKRQHFHHFMQDVHNQLNELSGKEDSLKKIAQKFSEQYHVLCFDEFFVSDIGDAMLLGNLLQFMFELNIVVVSTSNCAPDQLYRNGLQRERFLPAIKSIEQYTHVVQLSGIHDHRHRTLTYAQNYFELPHSEQQQVSIHQTLLRRFGLKADLRTKPEQVNTAISNSNSTKTLNNTVNILGRSIRYITKNIEEDNKVICFEFSELCQGPRSHFDYVELAKKFTTLLLFNTPPMSGQAYERIKARGTEDNGSNINVSARETGEREVLLAPMDDAARRFISLVDECYDCNLNLFITAYVPQNQLYNSGTLMFEFERTKSRLREMASVEYQNTIKS